MSPPRSLRLVSHLITLLIGPLLGSALPAAPRKPVSVAMVLWRGETESERSFRSTLAAAPDFEPTFTVLDARGDPRRLRAQVEEVKRMSVDLIYTFGTTVTRAFLDRVRDRPIVFNIVARPIESGIIRDWPASGNNATGVSNAVPMASVFRTLRLIMHIRKLGFLYNPSETNAEVQRQEVEREQNRFGFRLLAIPVGSSARLPEALRGLLAQGVDGVLLPSDSLIQANGAAILAFLNKYGIPSIASVPEMVASHGALLGLGPDYRLLGDLAARNALEVLRGAPPGRVPSRTGAQLTLAVNLRTAQRLGISLPIQLVTSSTLVP